MKKLFVVLAVASLGFAACNNESTTETSREDSIKRADSIRKAEEDAMKMQTVPDSTFIKDSIRKADSLKNAIKK